MKLARRYNTLVCITALVAALAYCSADDGTLLLGLLSIIACTVGWYAGRGDRPWALPRWVVNVLMLAAIIDATLKVLSSRSYSGFWVGGANMPIVSTLSQFLVYILLAKLFDRRSPRDEAHLLSLSIFVVVGAVLTSNTLLVGLFTLIFAPCVICSAMLLQLVGGARAVQDWAGTANLRIEPPLDLPASSRRRFRRDFLAAATVAVVGTLSLATAAFILMPRGLWKDVLGGFGKLDQGAAVGFTDQARLGQSGLLQNQDDQSPVLQVRLTTTINNKTENLGEIRGTLYLRGAVKTRYRRATATWEYDSPSSTTSPLGADDDLSEISGGATDLSGGVLGFELGPQLPLRLGIPSRGQIQMRQEFRLARPIRSPAYFFTIWRPLEIRTDRPAVVFFPGREMVLRAASGAVGLPMENIKEYSVLSAMEYSDPREPARENITFDSTVVRAIAEEILTLRDIPLLPEERDAAANRRAALAFVDYLRTTCAYDRYMSPPQPGEDPIEMFLTRTRRGHCEYFASAFVGLCHSVGLDARYIAGYIAAEFNRVSGEYVVRESNAHAWAEVRIAPGRWQTFDPSPPSAIDEIHRRHAGFFARLRQWYDAINFTWSNSIVSFDVSKQERIVGAQENLFGRLYGRVGAFIDAIRRLPQNLAIALRVFVIIVTVIAFVLGLRRALAGRRRSRGSRRTAESELLADPVMARLLDQVAFYEDALSLLRRSDLAKPLHRPPALHARALEPSLRSAADAFAVITDLYYRVRFGRRSLSAAELATAQAAVSSLSAHLQRHNENAIALARNANSNLGLPQASG